MKKGMAIIEVSDTEVKGIHIDQEALEFARQNAKIRKRSAKEANEKRKVEQQKEREYQKLRKAEARRKAYTVSTIKAVLSCCGVAGAVTLAGMAELIHPIVFIPVSLFCLCAACLRLGAWFGKGGK